jgi:hypothetical protein
VALAVRQDRLRFGVQRARGDQRRLGQVGDDRVGAAVNPAVAVVVVVVPGRVGAQQVAEPGEVAAGERAEQGADDIDIGGGGGAGGHGWLLLNRWVKPLLGTVGSGHRPQLSTVQSIVAAAAGPVLAARPCRIANMARPARVETAHLA